jgi:hypothetical protein
MSLGPGGKTSSSHMDSHNSWYKNRGQGNSAILVPHLGKLLLFEIWGARQSVTYVRLLRHVGKEERFPEACSSRPGGGGGAVKSGGVSKGVDP